jgi:GalNAc-alpha-(1->4)-GalNAc-alpha-(1->3)-diNAcBac-PP-undecaprenol alpha-1,4-N-acetyl-D-galactosaminyltransferase
MSKLVIVTNSLTGGGAERAMNQVTHELSKNHEVTLIAINSGPPDLISPVGNVIELNRKWQSGILSTIRTLKVFLKSVKDSHPDLVVLNCDLPEFFGCFLPRTQQVVVIEHVNFPFSSRVKLGILVRKILKSRGAVFASVSKHLKIWPENCSSEYILENPLEIEFVTKSDKSSITPISELVFIGRLINPQKRPDIAIEIAAGTELPIRIIGDGPLRSELEILASSKKVSAKFLGHVLNPWESLQEGSLLLLTSAYEGDGLVAVEAFGFNIPVLLSSNNDFRRFGLPDVNYCTSTEGFISKINALKSDISNFQIDEDIRSSLIKPRSLENVSKQWSALLRDLLG